MTPLLFVLAAFWATGGVDRDSGLAQRTERAARPASKAGAEGFSALPVFLATGVRDSSGAATVVHCTNLGGATRTVYVDVWGFDAVHECSMSTSVAPGETHTLTTRPTALYVHDTACATAPLTDQGSLRISVSAWTDLICTVQIVDPASSTPKFAERLDLFDRNGIPLANVIFADGFESGSTSEWSSPAV